MRITLAIAVCGLSILSSNIATQAQQNYLSLYSGWVFLDDYNGDFEPPPPAPIVNRNGDFNDGWALGGAIGRRLSGNCRIESEFFYRNNSGNSWTAGPAVGPMISQPWSGELNCYSSMFNYLHDVPQLGGEFLTPYVGGGIGLAVLDGNLSTATTNYRIDETEFAFQGIAGLDTQLTDRLHWLTEYRYFGATTSSLRNAATNAQIGEFNYSSHNVFLGLQIVR